MGDDFSSNWSYIVQNQVNSNVQLLSCLMIGVQSCWARRLGLTGPLRQVQIDVRECSCSSTKETWLRQP